MTVYSVPLVTEAALSVMVGFTGAGLGIKYPIAIPTNRAIIATLRRRAVLIVSDI